MNSDWQAEDNAAMLDSLCLHLVHTVLTSNTPHTHIYPQAWNVVRGEKSTEAKSAVCGCELGLQRIGFAYIGRRKLSLARNFKRSRFECNRSEGKLIVRENYENCDEFVGIRMADRRRVKIEICESKEIIFNLNSKRSISQQRIGHHAYGKLIKSFDWKIKFNLISFELI